MADDSHKRRESASDGTVEAVGKVSEAFEWIERARGRLYDFHHLIGRADFLMEAGADLLEKNGEHELSRRIREEVIGRNVLDGRWTFQVVEEFDDVYYDAARRMAKEVREELTDGKRHVYEAELKEARRSRDRAGHESRPPARHLDEPGTPESI